MAFWRRTAEIRILSAALFQSAVHSDPQCFSALVNLAVAQLRLSNFEQAGENATLALRMCPSDAIANFARVAAQYALNQLTPEAESGLELAAGSVPAAAEGLLNAIEKELPDVL